MFQLHSTSKSCWGTLCFSSTQPLFEVKQLKGGSSKTDATNFYDDALKKLLAIFSWICWLICKSFEIEKWFNAHSYLRLAGHHNNVAHFILSITFLGQFSRRQRGTQRVLRTVPSGETTKNFNSLHSQQNSYFIDSRGKLSTIDLLAFSISGVSLSLYWTQQLSLSVSLSPCQH